MRYNEIFETNKPMLKHPDKIYPGQVLRIQNQITFNFHMNNGSVL